MNLKSFDSDFKYIVAAYVGNVANINCVKY